MKRFLCVLLVLLLIIPEYAIAKNNKTNPAREKMASMFDLSGFSLDELIELRELVQIAMWANSEWQSVTVPQGVYIVGKDIPEGTWTVKCNPKSHQYVRLKWGDKLDKNGVEISIESKRWDNVSIYSTNTNGYEEGNRLEYTFTVKKGDYITIEYNSAIFSNPVSPSLGFK